MSQASAGLSLLCSGGRTGEQNSLARLRREPAIRRGEVECR